MTCNKYGGKQPPVGKNITAYPFCDKPTQTPSLETSPSNVTKALVQQYGESVLLDSKLFSLVADMLQNKAPQMLKRMRLAIHENIPQKLYALKSANEQERLSKINVIAVALKDDYDMRIETAYEIVHCFADSLGYKLAAVPKKPSGIPASPTAPPRQSVVTPKPAAPQMKSPNKIIKTGPKIGSTISRRRWLIAEYPMKISLKIGNVIPLGSYEWRVLYEQDDKALVITENIIEKRPYSVQWTGVTWKTCTLRKYLNGKFLQKFTREEQDRIVETRIHNPDNLWYGTHGGRDTHDKIFLLSLEEVDRYFGNSGDYQNKRRKKYDSGKYVATNNGSWFSNGSDSDRQAKFGTENSWWWLRSPGIFNNCATSVDSDGTVYVSGLDAFYDDGGIRPALWLYP